MWWLSVTHWAAKCHRVSWKHEKTTPAYHANNGLASRPKQTGDKSSGSAPPSRKLIGLVNHILLQSCRRADPHSLGMFKLSACRLPAAASDWPIIFTSESHCVLSKLVVFVSFVYVSPPPPVPHSSVLCLPRGYSHKRHGKTAAERHRISSLFGPLV